MFSRNYSTIALGLTALSLVACASKPSHPPGGPGGPDGPGGNGPVQMQAGSVLAKPMALLFSGYDADRDLVVTHAEFTAGLAQEWQSVSGSAGAMSVMTFSAWKVNVLGHKDVIPGYRRFDMNGDGNISQYEFETYFVQQFASMDENKDNQLERSELVQATRMPAIQSRHPQPQRGGQQGGGPGGGGPGGGMGGPGGGGMPR